MIDKTIILKNTFDTKSLRDKTAKIICTLIGHQEKIIEDIQLNEDVIVSDDLKAKDFIFPVYIHKYRCKICKKIRQTYPDIPGSNGGRYKVHYF